MGVPRSVGEERREKIAPGSWRETYERGVAGSSMAHARQRMSVPRPARGRKSPSNQAFRSRAARRGSAAGDKVWQHRPVQRELADIGRRRLGRSLGRGVIGLEIDDQNLVRRDDQPVDLARHQCRRPARQRPAVRRSPPRRGCRRRTPAAKRGSAIKPSTLSASAAARSRSSRARCGRDSRARRRAGARGRCRAATAAADAPACRAARRASRGASDSPAARDGLPRPRRTATGAAGASTDFAPAAGVRSQSGNAMGVLAAASAAPVAARPSSARV